MNKYALSTLTILPFATLGACEESAAERREEATEQRTEQLQEAAEQRAENREEMREKAEEARYDAPKPGAKPDEVVAPKGLGTETVESITKARCAREEKCGNIGTDEDFATLEVCRQKIAADWEDEINAYDCPGGIVEKELDECLSRIESEDCSSPFDTLGRVVACRSSDICQNAD
jgi:hypothetical protein